MKAGFSSSACNSFPFAQLFSRVNILKVHSKPAGFLVLTGGFKFCGISVCFNQSLRLFLPGIFYYLLAKA
jgi:hypothetical protein